MNFAPAAKALADAFEFRLRPSYQDWLEYTDYEHPMGDMIELLATNKAWSREIDRFMTNNWKTLKEEGFGREELTCSWYLARILRGPNPRKDEVLDIYLYAFV